jgi:hypothetical protein
VHTSSYEGGAGGDDADGSSSEDEEASPASAAAAAATANGAGGYGGHAMAPSSRSSSWGGFTQPDSSRSSRRPPYLSYATGTRAGGGGSSSKRGMGKTGIQCPPYGGHLLVCGGLVWVGYEKKVKCYDLSLGIGRSTFDEFFFLAAAASFLYSFFLCECNYSSFLLSFFVKRY